MRPALLIILAGSLISAHALADQALAKAKNCLSCHAVDKKIVGPAYQEVARKYAGQKDAADKLASKIMKVEPACGGSYRCRSTARSVKPKPKGWRIGFFP